MILAEGVAIIPLEIEGILLNSTLVWDEHGAILIDAGFHGHDQQIVDGMRTAGVPFERLSDVILTHQDIDHIGGVQDLIKLAAKPLTVYAHALDQPFIEGTVPLLKRELPSQLQHMFDLPYQVKVNHTDSLRKLLDYDIGQIVCYHGGLCTEDVNGQLRRIVGGST